MGELGSFIPLYFIKIFFSTNGRYKVHASGVYYDSSSSWPKQRRHSAYQLGKLFTSVVSRTQTIWDCAKSDIIVKRLEMI